MLYMGIVLLLLFSYIFSGLGEVIDKWLDGIHRKRIEQENRRLYDEHPERF